MKRILTLLLAGIMAASLSACRLTGSLTKSDATSSGGGEDTGDPEQPFSERTDETTGESAPETGAVPEVQPNITGFTKNPVTERDGIYYYSVEYTLGSEVKRGYMSQEGVITSEIPAKTYKKTKTTSELYAPDGSVSFTKTYDNYFDGVLGEHDGTYVWREEVGDIDSRHVYLGLVDRSGTWLHDSRVDVLELTGSEFMTHVTCWYLGEDMFAVYDLSHRTENYMMLLNAANGFYIYIKNISSNHLSFHNGTMICQQWEGGQAGGRLGNIYSVSKGGTAKELAAEGTLIGANEYGFLTDKDGFSFYDRDGNLKWSFNRYELVHRAAPILYGEYIFANVLGADNNGYTIVLDRNGSIVRDPIKYCADILVNGHYTAVKTDTGYDIVDLATGAVNASIAPEEYSVLWDLGYHTGSNPDFGKLFILKVGHQFRFYDTDGKEVTPTVREN